MREQEPFVVARVVVHVMYNWYTFSLLNVKTCNSISEPYTKNPNVWNSLIVLAFIIRT